MPRGATRRATGAVALALITTVSVVVPSLAAPNQSTPETPTVDPVDLATIKPVDTPDIDPVLDAVPVEETAAIRRADEDLEASAKRQSEAVLRWIEATQRLSSLAGKAGSAASVAADAQRSYEQAQADLAASERELLVRSAEEKELRAVLAEHQEDLRQMVAHLFATAPEDRYEVLGTFDDFTEASRRDALRDRSADLETRRVEEAHEPWAKARKARIAQEGRVAKATTATEKAQAEALRTADERDRFDQLVAAADRTVKESLDRLGAARADSRAVLVERRKARLASSVVDLDLPLVALDAYWRASALAPCHVPWWVIAGVGRVESGHGSAHGSSLTVEGDTTVHILGIPLDGRPGTIAIRDTDGGRLDSDPVWDRAVGPMQFIPGTWGRWATDDNADEQADPHNIYDAAGAAAKYLCFSRGDLDTEAKIRNALLAYNRSVPYGSDVLAKGGRYRDALDLPDVPGGDQPNDGATTTTTRPGG